MHSLRALHQMITLSTASGTHRKSPKVVGVVAVAPVPVAAVEAEVEDPGIGGTFSSLT